MLIYAENISGSVEDNWLFLEVWLWGNRQGERFLLSTLYSSVCSKNMLFTMSMHYLYNKTTTIQSGSAIKEIYIVSTGSNETSYQI